MKAVGALSASKWPVSNGSDPAAAGKLRNVEAGRGIAALAVVIFHMNATAQAMGLPVHPWTAVFIQGVDFFFVISGFIIFHVHRLDIGHAERASAYLKKRWIRLFPLLWLVVAGWVAVKFVAHKPIGLSEVTSSLFLYPSLTEPSPPVIWTLRHELLFYLMFVLLIVNRRLGIAAFALWTVAVVGQLALSLAGHPVTGVASFFLSSFELDFVLGALVAWTFRAGKPTVIPFILGIVLAIGVLVAKFQMGIFREGLLDYVTPAATLGVLATGMAFAVLLYGMLRLEQLVRIPEWLMLLGSASYAIYLIHVPVQAIMQHAVRNFGYFGLLLLIVVPTIIGIALHLYVERPLSRLLRSRMLKSS